MGLVETWRTPKRTADHNENLLCLLHHCTTHILISRPTHTSQTGLWLIRANDMILQWCRNLVVNSVCPKLIGIDLWSALSSFYLYAVKWSNLFQHILGLAVLNKHMYIYTESPWKHETWEITWQLLSEFQKEIKKSFCWNKNTNLENDVHTFNFLRTLMKRSKRIKIVNFMFSGHSLYNLEKE